MPRLPDHDPRHREDFFGRDLGLRELGYLGRDVWTRAQPSGLTEHVHPAGFWELCWLARGRMAWQAAGEQVQLHGGDCFLTRPRERHGGVGGVMHPGELYWVCVDLGHLPGLAPGHARALAGGFRRLRQRRFPADGALGSAFADLIGEFRAPRHLAAPAARAVLHRLLIAFLRAAGHAETPAVSPPVLRALELIEDSLARPPRVAALAAAAGLGASRFHDRFRAETGCAPAEHIARRRIARAQALLRGGRPIGAVVDELGFASRAHFGAVFRRYVGVPPARWLEQAGDGR
jgi:AraC-like DNA-binding protein